jgi:LysM repeat protein
VRPGDTLFGIALANGDQQYQLAVRNGIVNPNLIRIGQRLRVCGPGGSVGPGPIKPPPGKICRSTHVVKPGENLYRISLLYGTNFLTIAQVNNLVSPDVIYAGQVLCIP